MKKNNIVIHIIIGISAFIFFFPFLWMLISMTNTGMDVTAGRVLPGTHFLENLKTVFTQINFIPIFMNSVIIATLTTGLSLIITSMGAYSFQIYASKKSEKLYNLILISMMIPFAALMIPLYKQIVTFHMLNTYAAVILQGCSAVFLLFFFRQSLKTFPMEMIEAARIDGANEFKIFLKIVVPSMKTTYAAAAIYAFMASWNNYLWPLLALKSQNMKTLPLAISSLASSNTPDYGAIMLLIVLSTLPMLIIFFLLQKHFVKGMVGSAK